MHEDLRGHDTCVNRTLFECRSGSLTVVITVVEMLCRRRGLHLAEYFAVPADLVDEHTAQTRAARIPVLDHELAAIEVALARVAEKDVLSRHSAMPLPAHEESVRPCADTTLSRA